MTTLASAVAIGDNQLVIDAPMTVGQVPGWVKIDTELLNVGGQHFRTGTTLVLSAPATAAHDNGATVTYAGRPYDADFLTATGGPVVSSRVDAVVAFDTPDILTGVDVFTLPAGALLLLLGLYIEEDINAGGIDNLVINFADSTGFTESGHGSLQVAINEGEALPVASDRLSWMASIGPALLADETTIVVKKTGAQAWTAGSVRVVAVYSMSL